jgi:hypothetical protein
MGKRQRRRQRQQSIAKPRPLSIPRRHDQWPAFVRLAGPAMTRELAALVDRQREAEAATDREVDRLVRLGVSWPLIAAALQVSRQAARQRWLRRQ